MVRGFAQFLAILRYILDFRKLLYQVLFKKVTKTKKFYQKLLVKLIAIQNHNKVAAQENQSDSLYHLTNITSNLN